MPRLRRLARRLLASLTASIGDVAFGMEDGAVSIAGLVFGVAASTNDSRIVVLAGATGAVAGAVSMMAGTYLDVESEQRRTAALVSRVRERVATDPARAQRRVAHRLQRDGFTGALMAALGVARARIAHEPPFRTALQTMAIAGAAALAGVVIGRLVTS